MATQTLAHLNIQGSKNYHKVLVQIYSSLQHKGYEPALLLITPYRFGVCECTVWNNPAYI